MTCDNEKPATQAGLLFPSVFHETSWRTSSDGKLVVRHQATPSGMWVEWDHGNPRMEVVGWRKRSDLSQSRENAGELVLQDARPSGVWVDETADPGSSYSYRIELRRKARAGDVLRSYVVPVSIDGLWVYGEGVQFQVRIPSPATQQLEEAEQSIVRLRLTKEKLTLERDIKHLIAPDSRENKAARRLKEHREAGEYRASLAELEVSQFRELMDKRRSILEQVNLDVAGGKLDAEEAEIIRDHLDTLVRGDATQG